MSAEGEKGSDVGQELTSLLREWLEVREIRAGYLVAKLHREGIQPHEAPEGIDILTRIFEQPKQQAQVMGLGSWVLG